MTARTASRALALAPLGMSTPYLTTYYSYAAALEVVQPQDTPHARDSAAGGHV